MRGERAWAAPLLAAIACCTGRQELAELRALGEGCLLDSDCAGALRCVFRVCHEECATSADCPAGARCVLGAPPHHVCLLPDEVACARSSDCPGAMMCAPDLLCRDACASTHDCVRDQVCTPQRACALPAELEGGLLPVLDPGPQGATACSLDSECVAPERCEAGACRLPCVVSEDCPSGVCVEGFCAPLGALGPGCVPGHQAACECTTSGESGVHVCDPDGSGYGPCAGCSGAGGGGGGSGGGGGGGGSGGGLLGGACPPAVGDPDPSLAWVSPIDFASGWPVCSPAHGPSGGVVLGGRFSGDLSLDGQTYTAAAGDDGFLAWFDGAGALDGALTYDTAVVGAVVVSTAGEVWAAGSYTGSPSLGGPALPAGPGCFLLKLSSAGAHQFSAGYPVTGGFPSQCENSSMTLALGPGGEVVLTSGFRGTVDFGAGPISSQVNNVSAKALALFDAGGTNQFAHAFGGGAGTVVGSNFAAMSSTGRVYFTSSLSGTVAFGGPSLTSSGDLDLVVAGFDLVGAHVFSHVFSGGPASTVRPAGAAADAAGQLVVVGHYDGSPDLGGGALPSSAALSTFDLRLDGLGAHVASGALADVYTKSFRLDAAGRIVALGEVSQAMLLGPCTLAPAAATPVAYRRDVSGAIDWVRYWPTLGLPVADKQLGLDAAGNLVVRFGTSGSASTTFDFGAGSVTGRNFLVAMSPVLP